MLVDETWIIQIYAELDYLYDSFCQNITYTQIYILKKHMQTLNHYIAHILYSTHRHYYIYGSQMNICNRIGLEKKIVYCFYSSIQARTTYSSFTDCFSEIVFDSGLTQTNIIKNIIQGFISYLIHIIPSITFFLGCLSVRRQKR